MTTVIDGVEYWSKAELMKEFEIKGSPMNGSTFNSRLAMIGAKPDREEAGKPYFSASLVEVLRELQLYVAQNKSSVGFEYKGYKGASPKEAATTEAIVIVEESLPQTIEEHPRASMSHQQPSSNGVTLGSNPVQERHQDQQNVIATGATRAARFKVGVETVFQHALQTGYYGDPELQQAVESAEGKTRSLMDAMANESPNEFSQSALEMFIGLGQRSN